MATNTYVALYSNTLTSAVSSITFSSIPQGYTDLVLVANGSASGASDIGIQFNGDSATNYSRTSIDGSGTTPLTGRNATVNHYRPTNYGNFNTNYSCNMVVNIFKYSNTTNYKSMLSRANNADTGVTATTGVWRSNSAITSIYLYSTDSQTFSIGSTFTVYGVAAAAPFVAKATGGTIYYGADGYVYHKFTSTGTFTPTTSLTADILVVAGGGGAWVGGGGAGGLLGFTSQSLTATGYTCTVGAGGAAGSGTSANGSNSQFGALTASVGGGKSNSITASTGGSGAGANYTGTGAAGTSGQGSAGGNGQVNNGTSNNGAGGGGGASAVGAPGYITSNIAYGGAGGSGATYNSTVGGTAGPYSFINAMGAVTASGHLVSGNYYYAGGGGGYGGGNNTNPPNTGGTGGNGGGGTGGSEVASATNGTANTGGGGGGAGGSVSNGTGGSGIIIIRYPN